MGEGEKEKECTTESKSRQRRDEKAPWALNYGSGEGGGVEKGRRRGGERERESFIDSSKSTSEDYHAAALQSPHLKVGGPCHTRHAHSNPLGSAMLSDF